MSDDQITVEIDGRQLPARKGQMLIEIVDANDLTVPRFCYHPKLSVAANCRMCLVEVEKAPKPLPACATPVMDGMKVRTRSAFALDAQRSVMEFLLINHPLDCPVCDEGGECQLQDTAMGFGKVDSRYHEAKRVVSNPDIGPLIATEMTRCIQCTRCVRFGEEVAGVKELGVTGRGESERIETYLQGSVESEVSGNMIDLCPVGALTSKPFRFTARSWELSRSPGIAPHDSLGSHVEIHSVGGRVKRVVPHPQEQVNDIWLSDRDRFAYTGLASEERLLQPRIKRAGEWHDADWQEALAHVAQTLGKIVQEQGADQIAALCAPNASCEEGYLLQKLLRGLGSNNLDHRLREGDFGDQAHLPNQLPGVVPQRLQDSDALLLVGSNLRKEVPLLALRVREGQRRHGMTVAAISPLNYDFNFALTHHWVVPVPDMVGSLAAIVAAACRESGQSLPEALDRVESDEPARVVAAQLLAAKNPSVILGDAAMGSPMAAQLRALVALLARCLGAGLAVGTAGQGANRRGLSAAGVLPHQGPGGRGAAAGLNAREMIDQPRAAYLVMGAEVEHDVDNPGAAQAALGSAFTVVLGGFVSPAALEYADVLLPIAQFGEYAGTFVGGDGAWRSFQAAVHPPGQARPGWKVMRVLGNLLEVAGFDQRDLDEVSGELRREAGPDKREHSAVWPVVSEQVDGLGSTSADTSGELWRVGDVPLYRCDPLVRRAQPLQRRADTPQAGVYLCQAQADRLGIAAGQTVAVSQQGFSARLPVVVDERVPMGAVHVPAAIPGSEGLGSAYAPVVVEPLAGDC